MQRGLDHDSSGDDGEKPFAAPGQPQLQARDSQRNQREPESVSGMLVGEDVEGDGGEHRDNGTDDQRQSAGRRLRTSLPILAPPDTARDEER